jgi:glutamine amidotransferase
MIVGVVDYGMGNLHSINRKLHILDVSFKQIKNPDDISDCDKVILPGVGHFGRAMQKLYDQNLVECLNEHALLKKKPILGICLGMQLMTEFSEEGNVKGLGWIKSKIVKFQVEDPHKFKIPHVGWNTVTSENSKLLDSQVNEFYFVHSYYAQLPDEIIVVHTSQYDKEFISGFEKDNIFGVQYHPEKSHNQGIELLKKFIDL